MTIMNVAGKLMRMLPQMEGAASRITLSSKQLQSLTKTDSEIAHVLKKAIQGVENPTLEIAAKAKSNYTIAGLRLKDGKNVVTQGALSITNPGTNQAVLKYKASDAATNLKANGFIDAGKVANGEDIAMSVARRKGAVKYDVEIGDATAHHLSANEQGIIDKAKLFNLEGFLKDYTSSARQLQKTLDLGMLNIRKFFRGDVAPKFNKANKVVANFHHEPVIAKKQLDGGMTCLKPLKKIDLPEEFIAKAEKNKVFKTLSPELKGKAITELNEAYSKGLIQKRFSMAKFMNQFKQS